MPSLDVDVAASYDDCRNYWNGTSWVFGRTATYVCAGYNSATFNKAGSGMRWLNITIPKGATITAAYLRLHCSSSYSGTVVRSKIRGELSPSAATFSDVTDFDGRPRAPTTVDWDGIPAWTAGTYYNSPEIKDIIQEIVNQDGWVLGNALVLFWDDFDDLSDHNANCRRYGGSWDSATYNPPRLHIEYTVEVPVVTTQAVTDITATTATGHGTITDVGLENASKRGICWNTTGSPTVADDKSEETNSFGTGAFSRPMTGLTPQEHYYVRAYAYNSYGYGYGGQVEFDTPWQPPASDIDVGADPIDRDALYASGRTLVNKNNPANASGTLLSVKIWAVVNMTGLRVGTFYTTNGNTLKCRHSVLIGDVEAGAERTFTGLSITVEAGDYIGCYFTSGSIEADFSGFAGIWWGFGEYIDPGDETEYTFLEGEAISLYGYRDIERLENKSAGMAAKMIAEKLI